MDDELKSFSVSRFQDTPKNVPQDISFDFKGLYPVIYNHFKENKMTGLISELKGIKNNIENMPLKPDNELISYTMGLAIDTFETLNLALNKTQ